MKQFKMSMFASEKDLYKAKAEYIEAENAKLRKVAEAASEALSVDFNKEDYLDKLSNALDMS